MADCPAHFAGSRLILLGGRGPLALLCFHYRPESAIWQEDFQATMSFAEVLVRAYFNYVYTPIYDHIVARVHRYRMLQERCVKKLALRDNDAVLCVGVGTGNEIAHILRRNRNVSILGVDYSHAALRKAGAMASRLGKEIDTLPMDVRHLAIEDDLFDKVLCIHVMDFIPVYEQATRECLRVLRDGGRFVLTYPSQTEGVRLGIRLATDSVNQARQAGESRIGALLSALIRTLAGILYVPLMFRRRAEPVSHELLEAMIGGLTAGEFYIEEETVYGDSIVYGTKRAG